MNVTPFPLVLTSSIPEPSSFWNPAFKAPYPTNAPWMNLVLGSGSDQQLVSPYIIKSEPNQFSFGFPSLICETSFMFQAFNKDFILQIQEGLGLHQVERCDDLSVTLNWNSRLRVPLVPGSPYITLMFNNATPIFSSIHAIIKFSSNDNFTKHTVSFNNSQNWIIYCSSPLRFNLNMSATSAFSGIIRVALVPQVSVNNSLLDLHSSVYPVGGFVEVLNFEIVYRWKTETWKTESRDANISRNNDMSLLMLTMPVHRKCAFTAIANGSSIPIPNEPQLCYQTLDGQGISQEGDTWLMKLPPVSITWHSLRGIQDLHARADICKAVKNDTDSIEPITIPSTYFNGKAMARIARLALIAEEVEMTKQVIVLKNFLKVSLSAWFDGTFQGNALLYDSRWGGIVSREGAKDRNADFGLGLYNDHHFHYGYFVYAAAVLAKLDPEWGRKYKTHVCTLVDDYMNLQSDSRFPRMRNFDFYALHSWAAGLFVFADGRNQESTSEAVNAYYAAALAGLAYGNLSLLSAAATLMSFEILSASTLWHVKEDGFYSDVFSRDNAVVGVLWGTKRDANLWFAAADRRTFRLGIQVLPVAPVTELLFQDADYVKRLVTWALAHSVDNTDAWQGFVLALRAIYDKAGAVADMKKLTGFDDGNSLSNLLWWAHSR